MDTELFLICLQNNGCENIMRVLILNTYYYPNMIGGTENSVKLLAERLVKEGHSVAVMTVDGSSKAKNKEIINGVYVFRYKEHWYKPADLFSLSTLDRIINRYYDLFNTEISSYLSDIIDVFKPDVVHTNNLYGFSTEVWRCIKLKRLPIVHTLRDYALLKGSDKSRLLSNVALKIIRNNEKYVDVVTAPSRKTLNAYIDDNHFNSSKAFVVVNAVELDLQETIEIIEDKRKRTSSIVEFLFVGMLVEIKGIKNLLDAFTKIDNNDIKLHICGEGELESKVIEACNHDDRIVYHGKLSKSRLAEIYKKVDVLIVPSVWEEPFGRVVIEGNQFGLPTIGSNKGGIAEILNNMKSGVLFQYDNPNELRNCIINFSNRETIKQFFNNIIDGLPQYSIEKQVESFTAIYKNVIKE